MGFNEILERARKQNEEAQSRSGSGATYIYPGEGSTSFRLLYNPKSNNIFRQISRHWSDALKKHIPCLEMYGLPCPFCEIKKLAEAKGENPSWKLDPQRKVIFHATYASADKPSSDKVKKGDTVVIMTARSVETAFNKLFVDDLSENLAAVLAAPSGLAFNLKRYNDGGFTKYEVVPSPFGKVESAKTDEEMVKLLDELPEINETYFPASLTDDLKKSVIEATEKAMEAWKIDPNENTVLNELKGGSMNPPVPGQN